MQKEEGIIRKTEKDVAWITTVKTAACKSCGSRGSCNAMGGGKEMDVEAINTLGAETGDRVVIGFKTGSLLKLSFMLYIFPILCLIAGGVIGENYAPQYGFNPQVMSPLLGFLLFGISFFVIRFISNKLANNDAYRPKIVKIKARSKDFIQPEMKSQNDVG